MCTGNSFVELVILSQLATVIVNAFENFILPYRSIYKHNLQWFIGIINRQVIFSRSWVEIFKPGAHALPGFLQLILCRRLLCVFVLLLLLLINN